MLEADSPDDVDDASLRQFRVMAGLDREPLLAYVRAPGSVGPAPVDGIDVPVLLVVGDDDENAGDPAPLAERLGATLVRVPGDHFTANSAPGAAPGAGRVPRRAVAASRAPAQSRSTRTIPRCITSMRSAGFAGNAARSGDA